MWRRWGIGLFVVVSFLCPKAFAQPQHAFRITFTDKAGSPSLSNPLLFLSQRSLDRRAVQGIQLDSTDQPVSPQYMAEVLFLTNGKKHVTSRWLNTCVVLLTDSSKILTLQGKAYVSKIDYVGYYATGLHRSTNNSKLEEPIGPANNSQNKTTGDPAYYGQTYQQVSLVNGDSLHDRGYRGEGKLIAVLDAGFRFVDTNPGFDSLRLSNRLVDKYDFVFDEDLQYEYSSHGTSSLSAMAGILPGVFIGTAPDAQYAIYRTEDEATEQIVELDNLVAAAERADSLGVDIINVSLGYNYFTMPTFFTYAYADIDGRTTPVARSANMATAKGILYVASAGNEGSTSWKYILTPGDADSALTVGSVNASRVPAGNSGFGPNASQQVKPDVCALGNNATVLVGGTIPYTIGGTSFATPQIAGWAACLMQMMPTATPAQLRKVIRESAHVYNSPGQQLGYGVPNFRLASQLLGVQDTPRVPNTNWLNVGPNPFKDHIELRFNQPATGKVSFTLTDICGRKVFEESTHVNAGKQLVKYTLPTLVAPGLYFLKAVTANREATVRLVKY